MRVNILCGIRYGLISSGIEQAEQVDQIPLELICIQTRRQLFSPDLIRFDFVYRHKIISVLLLIIRRHLFPDVFEGLSDQITRLIYDGIGDSAFFLSIN